LKVDAVFLLKKVKRQENKLVSIFLRAGFYIRPFLLEKISKYIVKNNTPATFVRKNSFCTHKKQFSLQILNLIEWAYPFKKYLL